MLRGIGKGWIEVMVLNNATSANDTSESALLTNLTLSGCIYIPVKAVFVCDHIAATFCNLSPNAGNNPPATDHACGTARNSGRVN
jgi:hypothetical protein